MQDRLHQVIQEPESSGREITKNVVEMHCATAGCPGCYAIKDGKKTQGRSDTQDDSRGGSMT